MKKDWREKVKLSVTGRCDATCRFCALKNTRTKEDLPIGLLRRNIFPYIDPFCEVTLCGGEPTLHPHLLDIVREVSPRARSLQIVTNGACVRSEEQVQQLAELLREFRNLEIVFSADTQHERGLFDFHARLERLLGLGNNPQVQFKVTEPDNATALETMHRLHLPSDRTRTAYLHTDLTFSNVTTQSTLFVCETGDVFERETDLIRGQQPLGSVFERSLRDIVASTY